MNHTDRLVNAIKRGLKLSRHPRRAFVAAFGAFALASCGISTEDSADATKPFKVSGPETTCLEAAIPVVQDYFQGHARADDVSKAWDCIGTALDTFTDFTRGSSADSYTAAELRSFLQTYFLRDTRITDELLVEVMRIKQSILGGANDRISRAELAKAHDILQVFKTETLRLLPYIDLISFEADKKQGSENPARVEAAIAALKTSMENLGQLLGKSNQPYEFKYLTTLMTEFGKLYPNWKGPEFVAKYIPTVSVLKAFIMRPKGDIIAPNEWSEFMNGASRLYQLYIRMHYLLSDRDVLNGEGLDHLTTALNELFDVVEGAINAKSDKIIRYADIDPLVDEVVRLDIMPGGLQENTVRGLVRIFIGKVFNPPVAGSTRRPETKGLDLRIFKNAREGFFGWLDMQRVWREVQTEAVKRQPSLQGKPIPMKTIRELWAKSTSPYKSAYQDLKLTLAREFPLIYTQEGTIFFWREIEKYGMDQRSFDLLNWKVHFARVVGMGWSANPDLNRYSGLTKEEFGNFFYDARPLAIDLELVERDDEKIWDTSFDESNMFMLTGDANKKLSFQEGLDFISYALSSGVMVSELYGDVRENCREMGQDGFGYPTVDADCFRGRMKARFNTVYRFLPTWVTLANKLGPNGFNELEHGLERAARENGYSNALVSRSEINRMTMVMQYIESIFVRFDVDQSGTISYPEAKNSYFLFKDLLTELAAKEGVKKEREVFAIFTYILHNGHPPQSWKEKLYFKFIWSRSESRWNRVNADRLRLLNIVGTLAEAKD